MKRLLRTFAWLLCLAGPVTWADQLTIATYNVENYGPANRLTEAGYRKDYPKPEPEKRAVRRVIQAIGADLLVLQEMGPEAYLRELQRDLRNEGCDYAHAAIGTATDPARVVAILSRRPLRRVTVHDDLEFSYFGTRERVKRGLLEASVDAPGGEVTVFALHLKSRYSEREDDPACAIRRAGEATAIRDRILQRFPDPRTARIVLLGDCNDSKTSKPVAFLQRRGKTEIVRLLPVADSRGEGWTYVYRREDSYARVDHIFVSAALEPFAAGGAAKIYDGAGVREASDHRPVIVTLAFPARQTRPDAASAGQRGVTVTGIVSSPEP